MAQITLNSSGVASSGSLLLQTNGTTTQATVDTSGNLGLGVTPSAWGTYSGVLDLKGNGALAAYNQSINLSANSYYNGTNWIYKATTSAGQYQIAGSVHQWYTAASGTAGNAISFTQAMTLDASGNWILGGTTARTRLTLQVGEANAPTLGTASGGAFFGNSSVAYGTLFGTSGSGYGWIQQQRVDGTGTAYDLCIQPSGGNLLVGTTTGNVRLVVNGSTGAASFTGDDLNHYMITLGGKSASASTHYQIGFFKSTGSVVGSITHNDTTTTYNTSSDYRLKEVSGTLSGYKERLLSLQPKQGTWKENGAEFRGFLAHEFAESYPSSVTGEKDAVDSDGNPRYQGMQAGSSEVIADLVAYIKELETRLSALEA